MTLNEFYKQYASKGGSWVICIKGHAIGFRDGTTFDWTGDASKDYRGVNRRKTAKIGYRSAMSAYKIIDGPDPDADERTRLSLDCSQAPSKPTDEIHWYDRNARRHVW